MNMKSAITALSVLVLAAPLLVGCVKSPAAELKEARAEVEKEQAPERLLLKGNAFARFGDYTRAEQYFAAAKDAGIDERKVAPLLMEIYVRDHRYRDAIQYAEGFLRKHPRERRTRLLLATLEAAIGYSARAETNLETVLAADPDNADAHYAIALLYQNELARPLRADLHFREYLRITPEGPHSEEARGNLLTVVR